MSRDTQVGPLPFNAARSPVLPLEVARSGFCCYRSGSADAARSRATAPATTRPEPTAILGLRRCTARGIRRTQNTAIRASPAITFTVSRRGLRRPDRTRRTIPATSTARPYRGARGDSWLTAGDRVPAVAGTCMPCLRIRSFSCSMCRCASAWVGASVPRPHATSPNPAALAHAAMARCRRPAAQCPAPTAAWVTTGATGDTHSSAPEGLVPSRRGIQASRSSSNRFPLSSRAIPALSPRRRVRAKRSRTTAPGHYRPAGAGQRDPQTVTTVIQDQATWKQRCSARCLPSRDHHDYAGPESRTNQPRNHRRANLDGSPQIRPLPLKGPPRSRPPHRAEMPVTGQIVGQRSTIVGQRSLERTSI